jgi:hypothetical protein
MQLSIKAEQGIISFRPNSAWIQNDSQSTHPGLKLTSWDPMPG